MIVIMVIAMRISADDEEGGYWRTCNSILDLSSYYHATCESIY